MGKQKHIPKLRFREFGGEWEKTQLTKVLNLVLRPVETPSSPYTSIGVRSHFKGTLRRPNSDPTKIAMDTLYRVCKDDIIVNITFAWEGAVAIAEEADSEGLVSHRFPTYTCKSNLLIDFFRFLYPNSRFKAYLELVSPGGAGRNRVLKKQDFLKYEIALPTLPEQKKIADFLSAIDERIQYLTKKKELLEQYKRGVMQKIFSQKLRFKDESGKPFPKWENISARSLFASISNKSHESDFPILAATQENGMQYRDQIGVKIISSDKSISTYKIVEKGDFVISLRSFQGGIEYSQLTGICSPAYTVLKPLKIIHDHFYRYYFKKDTFITQLNGLIVGIRDGKQISYEAFATLTLPYPSLPEQKKSADFLTAIDDKIEHVTRQVEKTTEFKKGLLQQMFV